MNRPFHAVNAKLSVYHCQTYLGSTVQVFRPLYLRANFIVVLICVGESWG